MAGYKMPDFALTAINLALIFSYRLLSDGYLLKKSILFLDIFSFFLFLDYTNNFANQTKISMIKYNELISIS
ncbi:hypothetical protein NIES2109_53240 [Nostoc sp. HK-01]|nr:hypothetical protein NIES2109_53240 [Nostoc sp. HK-01]